MLDHSEVLRALRQRLLTTPPVVDTGYILVTTISGSFVRLDGGSFVADGIYTGMEIFDELYGETIHVVRAVTNNRLTVDPAPPLGPEVETILIVTLPTEVAWENVAFTPTDGRWYMKETYLPGPSKRITFNNNGILDNEPAYVLGLYGIAGTGSSAVYKIASVIMNRFRPGLALPTADGHIVRVRGNPAPYFSEIIELADHAVTTITIPLEVRSNIS